MTIEESIQKMNKGRFQMVPVLEKESGRYLYSLSASDMLNHIINVGSYEKALHDPIASIPVDRLIVPCTNDIGINGLIDLLANQNYVPLVDGGGIFQGIITRKKVLYRLMTAEEE
ncbi:MAG: CBS domain-containing protein [Bacilli bacterium]|nr:CBS domain-containing protein [Bacilli bacterium]